MGHHGRLIRVSGAGKQHEWKPYHYAGELPQAPVVVIGDMAGAFAALNLFERRQKAAARTKELSFKLGRKVEELSNLRKETDNLVEKLEKVEGGSGVITSEDGRAILAQIIANNKKLADLRSVVAELKKKLNK
jgi:hypothetical protein